MELIETSDGYGLADVFVRILVGPLKRKVPRRGPNADYRSREYRSEKEVGEVIAAAATQGRHGLRDSALILIAYRHGLRVSELVSLRGDQIDLAQGLVHVARLNNGMASVASAAGAGVARITPVAAGGCERRLCVRE